jgi:hypothetical protein
MTWKWYSAKTLYRIKAHGRPREVDAGYKSSNTLVEERLVLFRARSFQEAIRRAEAEADEYVVQFTTVNRYAQRVSARRLRAVEVFEMFDPPNTKVEVWSQMRVASSSVSDQTLVEHRFGPKDQPQLEREQFVDGEIVRALRPPRK